MAPIVQDFVVRIVEGTHPQTSNIAGIRTFVKHGSSPRGAQAIVLASKVLALRDGRFSPSFDDVRKVAAPALRHRILLNFEAEVEGVSTDDLIMDLIKNVPEG
jgi:MoxR-like ATPase